MLRSFLIVTVSICVAAAIGCRHQATIPEREPAGGSGWIEEAAARRGYIKAGDFAQFGCPPGWHGVEDTAAALRAVREMGGTTRGRKGDVDALAATVLLQHALALGSSR